MTRTPDIEYTPPDARRKRKVVANPEKVITLIMENRQPDGSFVYPGEWMPDGRGVRVEIANEKSVDDLRAAINKVQEAFNEREKEQDAAALGEAGIPTPDSGRGDPQAREPRGSAPRSDAPVPARQETLQETLARRQEYLNTRLDTELDSLQKLQQVVKELRDELMEVEACMLVLQKGSRETLGEYVSRGAKPPRKRGSTKGGRTASKKKTTTSSGKRSSKPKEAENEG